MTFGGARFLFDQLAISRERAFIVACMFEHGGEKEARLRILRAQGERRAKGACGTGIIVRPKKRATQCELRVEVVGRKRDGLRDGLERRAVVAAHSLND